MKELLKAAIARAEFAEAKLARMEEVLAALIEVAARTGRAGSFAKKVVKKLKATQTMPLDWSKK